MKIPGLSESLIGNRADQGSVERGKDYYEDGAVKSLKRRSDTEVEAFVQGTDIAPYQVHIKHDDDGITDAECTCPYVKGSWCRHIVAALYAVIESEGALSRPAEEILETFDRAELVRLMQRILDDHPEVASMLQDAHQEKQAG